MDSRKQKLIIAQLMLSRGVLSDAPLYVQQALKAWCKEIDDESSSDVLDEKIGVTDTATVSLKEVN